MKLRESERQALELEGIQYRNRILQLTADLCNIVRDQNDQLKAEIAELRVSNRWLMEQLRDSQRGEDALEEEAREARDHERDLSAAGSGVTPVDVRATSGALLPIADEEALL